MARPFLVLLLPLFFCSLAEAAAENGRSVLIADFAEAMGIEQLIVASKDQTRKGVVTQGDIVIANLQKAGYSDEALAQVRGLYEDLMRQVIDSWTPEEAAHIYTEAIAETMTDDDLKVSVSFYKTSEGRQSVKAAGSAASRLQAYIQGAMTTSMRTAMADFTDKLKVIAAADIQKRTKSKTVPGK